MHGVLVIDAVCQLSDSAACNLDHEDVSAAVVVEPREPLGRRRLVEISCYDDWIAGGLRGFRPRGRGYEGDCTSVGSPRQPVTARRKWMVRSRHFCKEFGVGTVCPYDDQTSLITL